MVRRHHGEHLLRVGRHCYCRQFVVDKAGGAKTVKTRLRVGVDVDELFVAEYLLELW